MTGHYCRCDGADLDYSDHCTECGCEEREEHCTAQDYCPGCGNTLKTCELDCDYHYNPELL